MNRVFQLVAHGEKFPLQFSSRAKSVDGVFRAFGKHHRFGYLQNCVVYYLYGRVAFGFQKIAAAYWNGKAFVKVAINLKNKDLVEEFLNNNKDFVL